MLKNNAKEFKDKFQHLKIYLDSHIWLEIRRFLGA